MKNICIFLLCQEGTQADYKIVPEGMILAEDGVVIFYENSLSSDFGSRVDTNLRSQT